jgi:glycosyltransferase involved in cell wall biosynthesis
VRKVTVVTPCFNARPLIEETVRSVLGNRALDAGNVQLQYLVRDGGSTDGTPELVQSIFDAQPPSHHQLSVVSRRDGGMYEALADGLGAADGDVCAYVNAGDFFSPSAFEIALDLLARPGVDWITGLQVRYNERSHLVSAQLPFNFRGRLIRCGRYDGGSLPFIQQESTFWNRPLNALLDLDRLSNLRFAGDYYLWNRFAQHHRLFVVEAWLGGFKVHRDQKSENMAAYLEEMRSVAERPTVLDRAIAAIDGVTWHLPNRVKRRLNPSGIFSFDFQRQEYLPHDGKA